MHKAFEKLLRNWRKQRKSKLSSTQLLNNERKNLKKPEKFNWPCKKGLQKSTQHGKTQKTWFETLWFPFLIDYWRQSLQLLKKLQNGLKKIRNWRQILSLLHELWLDWLSLAQQLFRQSQQLFDFYLDRLDGSHCLHESLHDCKFLTQSWKLMKKKFENTEQNLNNWRLIIKIERFLLKNTHKKHKSWETKFQNVKRLIKVFEDI